MQELVTFFIIVILVEVACIVGIIYALGLLHRWQMVLVGARVSLMDFKRNLNRQMKLAEFSGSVLAKTLGFSNRYLPWWLKIPLFLIKLAGKIKPQTS